MEKRGQNQVDDWLPPDKPAVTQTNSSLEERSKNESIKLVSKGLYYVGDGSKPPHTLIDEVEALALGDNTTLSNEAKELTKFFGVYRQKDRSGTGKKGDINFFMVRIRCPGGGELSPTQWGALNDAAELYGDGTLRLTSRQSIQFHHVFGPKLAPLIRHLNKHYRKDGTLSACGDVNRNVMCSPIDGLDPVHQPRAKELANEIAEALSPRTSAYFQVWVSDEEGRNLGPVNSEEPLYGEFYLPRKFKVGLGHATDNHADVFTQDVGFFPVIENGVADGSKWDLYSGGGMGLTQNNVNTAPLLGLYLGRIRRGQAVAATKAILTLQKEEGERKDRKFARWKYTIRRLGLERVKKELRERFGIELAECEPQAVPPIELYLGWRDQGDGKSVYGISIPAGRLRDEVRKGIRRAVEEFGLGVRLTAHQNILLCHITDREAVLKVLDAHGVPRTELQSSVQQNSMACPALPTCGLAMTNAEVVLPEYIGAIEKAGLGDIDVTIRMTGCPNNCVRSSSSEIGIYGFGKNAHTILVGGSRAGTRIGKILYAKVTGEAMASTLIAILRTVREHCPKDMPVGDFLYDTDVEQLRAWVEAK